MTTRRSRNIVPQRISVLAAVESDDYETALRALRRRVGWQLGRTVDARAVCSLVGTLLTILAELDRLEGRSAGSAPSVLAEVRLRRLERQRRATVQPVEPPPSTS
ncbi:MAG: hypothetical protein QJR12_09490 [Mycobacterium sp.]|uniref:hypothetical protein n=1 Tax=Mycobacterium sp. TaxID=1785 RepID=UPI00261B9A8B|nr:hypothetical protein [Mycobacterium sp.]MDI3314493.1 hypothetical protein [Mycobacterium sp.]